MTIRTRRMAAIDRTWLGYSSTVLAVPVETAPPAAIRAALAELMIRRPAAPLACRLDEGAGRWVPVGAAQRGAHLDRILTVADDPAPTEAGLEAHIAAHAHRRTADLPITVVVTPSSLTVHLAHPVGDAATFSRVLAALARADADALDALTPRVGTGPFVRALVRDVRPHGRAWWQHLRHPVAAPVGVGLPPGPARPAFATAVLDGPALKSLTKWRNAHHRGVSLTAVLTTLAYMALTRSGVPVYGAGSFGLIDVRDRLAADVAPNGNFAKALYLPADLADPASVASAWGVATASNRALPGIVAGAAACALRTPSHGPGTGAPVTLTFNSMPSLPGVADVPWRVGERPRLITFGLSTGAGGVTVFALRMRDHLQLTASFDETTASAPAVRAALDEMRDPLGLLAAVVAA